MTDISRRQIVSASVAGLVAMQASDASAQATEVSRAGDLAPDTGETPVARLVRPPPEGGVGLALSGGGYKAAVFHLGSLLRLNELGALPKVKTISSVSGGSITNAALATGWSRLQFGADGVAGNFKEVVIEPLMGFCRRRTIDISSFVRGIGPFSSAPHELSRSYRPLLGEATLADLPKPGPGTPEFVFNTSNMELNTRFSFSQRRAYDFSVGTIRDPRFVLTDVVAASSSFPPIFAPFEFDFTAQTWDPSHPLPAGTPESYRGKIALADGGIYDNMGLEAVWKDCRVVLVSNAGNPFPDDDTPPHEWFSQLRRVVSMVHRQAENNRKRWLIERTDSRVTMPAYLQEVALWQMEDRVGEFSHVHDAIPAPGADGAAGQKVRLKALSHEEAERLYQHGYSLADASVRSFWPAYQHAHPPGALPLCPV